MPAEHVLLIARYDVLATAEPGDALPQVTGFARLSDPEADVSAWAARARAAAPDAAILIDSTPEEKSALAEAGIPTIDWPERWLPVSDYLYRDPAQIAAGTGVFFFGATNDRRDRFLQPVKHRFDVLHLVGGASATELSELMGRCDVAIDLQLEAGVPRLDRTGPAMAQGMLILAEQPVERDGVARGAELFTFASPEELELLVDDTQQDPERYLDIRRAGRKAAEQWRSSSALRALLAAEFGP